MSRIRSIHPGLLTDEHFMALTVEAPLAVPLLLGIWMDADDRGVFEWKPLSLKARTLPAANVGIDDLLAVLEQHNFIRRFEANGRPYGAVRNFTQWQRPKAPKHVHPFPNEIAAYVGLRPGTQSSAPSPSANDRGQAPTFRKSDDLRDDDFGTPSEITSADAPAFPQNGETRRDEPRQFPQKGEIGRDERPAVPQKGEIGPQREEGGGRRKEEGGIPTYSPHHQAAARDGPMMMTAAEQATRLQHILREAAGLQNSPAPMLVDISPIKQLLDRGLSLETNILPVIRMVMAKVVKSGTPLSSINRWSYFVGPIEKEYARNMGVGKNLPVKKAEDWAARMREWRNHRTWIPAWGPKPGEWDCRVPAEFLQAPAEVAAEEVGGE